MIYGALKIVTDGLAMYVDAANAKSYVSGSSIWYDLGASRSYGILVNSPPFNFSNGGSIVFDGVDDRVDFQFNSAYDISASLTIEAFVYPTAYKVGGGGGAMTVTKVASYYTEIDSNGKVRAYYYGLNNPGYHISTKTIPLNTWSHYAVVRDYNANNISFYINGNIDNTITSITGFIDVQQTYPLTLGSYNGAGYEYTGRIACARMYNKALSADEIFQNYNSQKGRFNIV